jgi:hypothetical protein
MKIKFLLTLVALLLTRFPFAQGTFSIVSSVGIDKLACVNDPVTYTLNSSYPSGVCSVTWQITAGTGTYVSGFGPSSNPTKIRWADQKPNKGTIKATVKHFQLTNTCNSGYEFSTVSRTTVIRSVLQESITGIVSPRDVQYWHLNVCNVSKNWMTIFFST